MNDKLKCFSRKRALFLDASIRRGSLRDDYQDEEIKANPARGRKIIKRLRDDLGIESRIPGKEPPYVDMFEGMLSDDPGGAIIFKGVLYDLKKITRIAEKETSERLASRDLLMEKLFDRFYSPETDLELRKSITGAFLEYHYSVELACRKLSYVRTACMYYGLWLVKDIPVDSIVSEKITEILGKEVDVFEDYLPLRDIPGFTVPERVPADKAVCTGDAAGADCPDGAFDPADVICQDGNPENELNYILEAAERIRRYILIHPQQIDAQCLMSVVTGTEELGQSLAFAMKLDQVIDDFSLSDYARRMDKEKWRMLFDAWVMTKAFCRIADLITSFAEEYKDARVGFATEALRDMLPRISYAAVERNIRITLRQTLLEGGVIEFLLSDVAAGDKIKPAMEKAECIALEKADVTMLNRLEELMNEDNRLVPVPQKIAWETYLTDISFICVRDKVPCGTVLFSRQGDLIVFELAYGKDRTSLAALIANAYDAAVCNYGTAARIVVPVLGDTSWKMVMKMVPGASKHQMVPQRDR